MSKVIILGSGAAPGVPSLAYGFGDCDPKEEKNIRLRSGTYMEISGVKLTEQEQNDLREGKKIFIEGMTARSGNPFDAHIQVNAERRSVEFIFENDKLFNRQYLGGVELTKKQVEGLNAGKAIFVEGMKRKDGELFSSYVKLDEATGRPSYTRYNPDSPEGAREIYIPNEIGGVKITSEEQKELREGRR